MGRASSHTRRTAGPPRTQPELRCSRTGYGRPAPVATRPATSAVVAPTLATTASAVWLSATCDRFGRGLRSQCDPSRKSLRRQFWNFMRRHFGRQQLSASCDRFGRELRSQCDPSRKSLRRQFWNFMRRHFGRQHLRIGATHRARHITELGSAGHVLDRVGVSANVSEEPEANMDETERIAQRTGVAVDAVPKILAVRPSKPFPHAYVSRLTSSQATPGSTTHSSAWRRSWTMASCGPSGEKRAVWRSAAWRR